MLAPRTDSFLWFIDTLPHQSLCFSVCMVETTPLVIPLIHSIYDDTLQIFSVDFAISDHHNGQRKERIGYTYIYNPLNYIRSVEREGKGLCHPKMDSFDHIPWVLQYKRLISYDLAVATPPTTGYIRHFPQRCFQEGFAKTHQQCEHRHGLVNDKYFQVNANGGMFNSEGFEKI